MRYRHGFAEHPLYHTWELMRGRCNNANRREYRYYGGRGIKVCERWDNFGNFLADMGDKPSSKHTLDRIDNDGDYTPENCRWATKTEQACNQQVRQDNKTGAPGVFFRKDRLKWISYISLMGKRKWLGNFNSFEKAVAARKRAEGQLWVS